MKQKLISVVVAALALYGAWQLVQDLRKPAPMTWADAQKAGWSVKEVKTLPGGM